MARPRRFRFTLAGWLIAIAVVVGFIYWLATREEALEVTADTVAAGPVEQTVTALAAGTVMAREDAMVAADSIGTVTAVHVADGDRVAAGDVLLELRHDELDAQVDLAAANLRVGQSRLEQARLAAAISEDVNTTRVEQTRAQLEQARSDLARARSLTEQRALATTELERAQLALRVAEENAEAAVATLRETAVRQEEIRSAELTLDQLEASLAVAEAMRDKAFIRAPFDGVVAQVLLDEGESVAMGMPVAQLVQPGDYRVEAPFDEADLAELRVGMPARLSIDAYRDRDFAGRVSFVAPVVSTNLDLSRTINVHVDVEEGEELFLPGMSADVIVVADARDEALYVPTAALVRNRWVYVIEGDRVRRQEVTCGIGNWQRTEVLGGLEEGDRIVTSVGLKGLEDGAKVRVVSEEEYSL
jgi:HlyD family secretion protein